MWCSTCKEWIRCRVAFDYLCRFENGQIIFFFTLDALEESLNLLESGDHENLEDNPEGKKSFKS
jgi:hypothetical protein